MSLKLLFLLIFFIAILPINGQNYNKIETKVVHTKNIKPPFFEVKYNDITCLLKQKSVFKKLIKSLNEYDSSIDWKFKFDSIAALKREEITVESLKKCLNLSNNYPFDLNIKYSLFNQFEKGNLKLFVDGEEYYEYLYIIMYGLDNKCVDRVNFIYQYRDVKHKFSEYRTGIIFSLDNNSYPAIIEPRCPGVSRFWH